MSKHDPPTTKWSGGSEDDKKGRTWALLTGIIVLFVLILKAYGVASWPRLIIFVVLISGGLAALIFRKNKNKGSGPNNDGAAGPGEK